MQLTITLSLSDADAITACAGNVATCLQGKSDLNGICPCYGGYASCISKVTGCGDATTTAVTTFKKACLDVQCTQAQCDGQDSGNSNNSNNCGEVQVQPLFPLPLTAQIRIQIPPPSLRALIPSPSACRASPTSMASARATADTLHASAKSRDAATPPPWRPRASRKRASPSSARRPSAMEEIRATRTTAVRPKCDSFSASAHRVTFRYRRHHCMRR
jgi:hypothetical protein